jgi:hypothetical protein
LDDSVVRTDVIAKEIEGVISTHIRTSLGITFQGSSALAAETLEENTVGVLGSVSAIRYVVAC